MVAEEYPSICWTTLTSAPDAIASEAAVGRSSCGCSPGTPTVFRCGVEAAVAEHRYPQRSPTAHTAEHQIVEILSGDVRREASMRNLGIGTSRRSWVLGVPTPGPWPWTTVTTE
jgi:hypothetical protein